MKSFTRNEIELSETIINIRTQDQLTDQVFTTCKAIEAQLKGRTHPKEREIIANQCEKSDLSESHIRKVMEIPEKRKKSTKYKEMSEEKKLSVDQFKNETLFLGLQTKVLMQYILTSNKKYKMAIDIANLAWAITKTFR